MTKARPGRAPVRSPLAARGRDPRQFVVLLLIVLVGAALRLSGLTDVPLWGDERFSESLAMRSLPDIVTPPFLDSGSMALFHLLAHLWIGLTDTGATVERTFVLRILPLFFSVAAIPVIYAVARHVSSDARLRGRAGALLPLLAAAVFSFGVLSVRYGQEFRGYSLQLLLLALLSLAALRAARGGARSVGWVAYAVLAALATYTHLLSVIFVAAQVGALFVWALIARRRSLLLTLMAVAISYGLVLVPLLNAAAISDAQTLRWISPVSLERLLWSAGVFAGAPPYKIGFGIAHIAPMAALDPSAIVAIVLALLPAVVGTVAALSRWRIWPPTMAVVLAPLALVPTALIVISVALMPIWVTRYMYHLLLPLSIVTALGDLTIFEWVRRQAERRRFVGALLGGLLLCAAIAIPLGSLAAVVTEATAEDSLGEILQTSTLGPDPAILAGVAASLRSGMPQTTVVRSSACRDDGTAMAARPLTVSSRARASLPTGVV